MKKKKTRRPKAQLSEKQIEKIKREITRDVVQKTCLLAVATMADTLSLSEDKVCEVASDIFRWAENIEEHVLQIQDIEDVIKKKTGIKFGRF